jgi:hypothetical protein
MWQASEIYEYIAAQAEKENNNVGEGDEAILTLEQKFREMLMDLRLMENNWIWGSDRGDYK